MGPRSDEMRDPGQIRADMDRTRDQMSQTVDAIQEKLDPTRLKNQAISTVRGATVGKVEQLADDAGRSVKGVGSDMFETIRHNPVPAALVAVGLGWLFMERRSAPDRNRFNRYDYQGRYYRENYPDYGTDYRTGRQYPDEGRYYGGQPMNQARGRMSQAAGNVQDRMSDAASGVQDKVSQAAGNVQDTVSQAAGNVQDTVSQVAGQARDQASQFVDQAQYTAQQAGTRFQELMDDRPLLVGAAALALGALIGMSLPTTPQENKLMGEARDNLMDKAQSAAQDTMGKVQQVAQQAGQAAKQAAQDEAQKQNLTTG